MRYIDDHRPLIEDINNTGQEVKVLCPQEEAEKVQNILDKVNNKYDEVKADIRNRWVQLKIHRVFLPITSLKILPMFVLQLGRFVAKIVCSDPIQHHHGVSDLGTRPLL